MNKKTLVLLAMMAAGMMGGCDWSNPLYNEYVTEDGRVYFCPPKISSDSETKKVKIADLNTLFCYETYMEAKTEFAKKHPINNLDNCIDLNKRECKDIDGCEECDFYRMDYLACTDFRKQGLFDYEGIEVNDDKIQFIGSETKVMKENICPKDYPLCSFENGRFGCIKDNAVECTNGQIKCDGECITPGAYGVYCGAKGDCSDENPDSDNYKGVECGTGKECNDGKCECSEGLIECDDKCISPMDNTTCGAVDCINIGNNCNDLVGKNGVTYTNCSDDSNDNYYCKVFQCSNEYHYDEKNNSCIPIDVKNCGYLGDDCTQKDGVDKAYCKNRVCIATDCKTGYHRDGSTCEKDNKISCGIDNVDCTIIEGWKNGDCSEGECIATSCQNSYHINKNGVCEYNSESCEQTGGKICNDICVNIKTNQQNCGDCNKECKNGYVCSDSNCKCEPDIGYILCKNECVKLNTNEHCNGCEKCPDGSKCNVNENILTDGLTEEQRCSCIDSKLSICNGSCVDFQTDIANCGGCGEKCDYKNISKATSSQCIGGVCNIKCDDNYDYNTATKNCERKKCSDYRDCSVNKCFKGKCEDLCVFGACAYNKTCYDTHQGPYPLVCLINCERKSFGDECNDCYNAEGETCVVNNGDGIGICKSGRCYVDCRENENYCCDDKKSASCVKLNEKNDVVYGKCKEKGKHFVCELNN